MRQKTLSILNHAMDEDKEKKDDEAKREKALEELEQRNPHFSRHKYKTIYPEPGDNSMVIKDSCPQFREVTYPYPTGGEMMIKRDIDTHRVELKKVRNVPDIKISTPEDVVRFVREMEDYDRERFKVIYLDNKNRVIGVENISEGTINAALVHPREAVKGAILANSAGVILIHNHPSGIPQPSREDDIIRTRLSEGFTLLGIDVTDVLIIGKEGYYSYNEAGRMPGKGTGGIERVMDKQDDKCSIALKAAMSTIKDYCGDEGKYTTDIILGGTKLEIEIPPDIIEIREDRTITEEQRTQKIKESPWAQNKANELCAEFMPARSYKCIERITTKLAEGMVSKARQETGKKKDNVGLI